MRKYASPENRSTDPASPKGARKAKSQDLADVFFVPSVAQGNSKFDLSSLSVRRIRQEFCNLMNIVNH